MKVIFRNEVVFESKILKDCREWIQNNCTVLWAEEWEVFVITDWHDETLRLIHSYQSYKEKTEQEIRKEAVEEFRSGLLEEITDRVQEAHALYPNTIEWLLEAQVVIEYYNLPIK